ncbi:hypothetical protein CMK11_08260 [Candidatus Poribacteria bacterium]|nr:hypothetical protein [Candidatus Poribacteria bacterium]
MAALPADTQIVETTGEFTKLRDHAYVDAIRARPAAARPVAIVGFIPDGEDLGSGRNDRQLTQEEFLAEMFMFGRRRDEVWGFPDFTGWHVDQVRDLMQGGRLQVYVLHERPDQPHWGKFGDSLYMQQRHEPGMSDDSEDRIILDDADPDFMACVQASIQSLIDRAYLIV